MIDNYDGQTISCVVCGLNFLTLGLQLKENWGKNVTESQIWVQWVRGNCITYWPFHHQSSRVFCPRAGPLLQAQEPRLQFCWRQVFHRELRNPGCSFTKDWICAVASHCFPHTTLSLASEQTLKDPRGTNVEVTIVDLANWALRTSPKFTTGVKYQFHQGFWPDQRSGNPNHHSPIIRFWKLYTRMGPKSYTHQI